MLHFRITHRELREKTKLTLFQERANVTKNRYAEAIVQTYLEEVRLLKSLQSCSTSIEQIFPDSNFYRFLLRKFQTHIVG